MDIPILLERGNRQCLQTQLYEQVRKLILGGRLKPGTPIPASRALARQLGVSRNTVMLAFDRLAAEGYLQMRQAIGTFVSFELPEDCLIAKTASPPHPGSTGPQRPIAFCGRAQHVVHERPLAYDFLLDRPDPRAFPIRIWRRLVNRVLVTAAGSFTAYRDPAGLIELRRAIAERLGPSRGIDVHPDQIVVVGGCQEGFNLAARLLLREGMRVAIENPTYQGAAFLYESWRTRMIPVRVDDSGICVDDLPADGAALLHITPSHQYPLGFTLSLERRLRLLDWARRTGTCIVEDDYDSDFRYRGAPLAALMGLDSHGSVIYTGTFTKSLGAGLRLGYLVVPAHLTGAARAAKALFNNGHPWLDQAVVAEFLASGSYDTHLRRIRQCYAERRDCLTDSLQHHFGEVAISGAECGMHLTWHLTDDLPRAGALQAMAAANGVGIYTLRSGAACDFGGCAYSDRTVMLGFSSLGERQIREGVARLAAAADAARSSAARAGMQRGRQTPRPDRLPQRQSVL